MLDELSAATGNDQLYGCRIIFIAAQYGKEFLHIGRSNITNTGKVSCVDLGGTGTQNLFHGMVTDFGAELTQDGFLGANHTLIDADFFSPAPAFLWLGILQIQKIHGSIANVRKQVFSLKGTQQLNYPWSIPTIVS